MESIFILPYRLCRNAKRPSHDRPDGVEGPIVAATDYMKIVPDQLSPWIGTRLVTLDTDGFGRSENRDMFRIFFEVNAHSIVCESCRA